MNGKLFAFRILKKTDPTTATRFCRALYGYVDKSNKGEYEYERPGFLDKIPHVKLIRGVIIVREVDARRLVRFLRSYGAEYYVREVVLSRSDTRVLG